MTRLFLSNNFAMQSIKGARLTVTQHHKQAGAIAALIEADRYPRTDVLVIEGLRPNRHYLLQGAAQRFCRAGDNGAVSIELALSGPTLLLLSPVL